MPLPILSKRGTVGGGLPPVRNPLLGRSKISLAPCKMDTFSRSANINDDDSLLLLPITVKKWVPPAFLPSWGFENLGNSCYMNAVLQCLLSLNTFTTDVGRFYQCHKETLGSKSVATVLARLITVRQASGLYSRIKCYWLCTLLLELVSTPNQNFSANVQQDAHEFLSHLLDKLKMEATQVQADTQGKGSRKAVEWMASDLTEDLGCPESPEKSPSLTTATSVHSKASLEERANIQKGSESVDSFSEQKMYRPEEILADNIKETGHSTGDMETGGDKEVEEASSRPTVEADIHSETESSFNSVSPMRQRRKRQFPPDAHFGNPLRRLRLNSSEPSTDKSMTYPGVEGRWTEGEGEDKFVKDESILDEYKAPLTADEAADTCAADGKKGTEANVAVGNVASSIKSLSSGRAKLPSVAKVGDYCNDQVVPQWDPAGVFEEQAHATGYTAASDEVDGEAVESFGENQAEPVDVRSFEGTVSSKVHSDQSSSCEGQNIAAELKSLLRNHMATTDKNESTAKVTSITTEETVILVGKDRRADIQEKDICPEDRTIHSEDKPLPEEEHGTTVDRGVENKDVASENTAVNPYDITVTAEKSAVNLENDPVELSVNLESIPVDPTVNSENVPVDFTVNSESYPVDPTVNSESIPFDPTVISENYLVDSTVYSKSISVDPIVNSQNVPVNPTVNSESVLVDSTVNSESIPIDSSVNSENVPVDSIVNSGNVPISFDSTVNSENVSVDCIVNSENVSIDSTVNSENVPVDSTVNSENVSVDSSVNSENVSVDSTVNSENVPVDSTVNSENVSVDSTVNSENVPVDLTVNSESIPVDPTVNSENFPVDPTSENFESKVVLTRECLSCHEIDKTTDTTTNLILDMPAEMKTATLQAAVNNFFKIEEIDYNCEYCERSTKAKLTKKFVRLPRVLILYLKRYQYDMQNKKVGVDLELHDTMSVKKHCNIDTATPLFCQVDWPRPKSEMRSPACIKGPLESDEDARRSLFGCIRKSTSWSQPKSEEEEQPEFGKNFSGFGHLAESWCRDNISTSGQPGDDEQLQMAIFLSVQDSSKVVSTESTSQRGTEDEKTAALKANSKKDSEPDELGSMTEEEQTALAIKWSIQDSVSSAAGDSTEVKPDNDVFPDGTCLETSDLSHPLVIDVDLPVEREPQHHDPQNKT